MAKPIQPGEIGRLLDEHGGSLELFAAQWSTNPEDCVQEAFIELATQAIRPEVPVAWLYRVVRNRAINASRAARRRTSHECLAGKLSTFRKSDNFFPAEEKATLIGALDSLSQQQRELIVLRIWSKLTWQQIADLTGTSTSSAHRRYVAALADLKELLEPACQKNLRFRTI